MDDYILMRNAERAQRVAAALMHYRYPDGTLGHWQDFLADFMHFAEREGVDFQGCCGSPICIKRPK